MAAGNSHTIRIALLVLLHASPEGDGGDNHHTAVAGPHRHRLPLPYTIMMRCMFFSGESSTSLKSVLIFNISGYVCRRLARVYY